MYASKLVSWFNVISTFCGLFNSKAIHVEEQLWYYCECNGCNVPGNSKRARVCLARRVKARNRYGCFKHYM